MKLPEKIKVACFDIKVENWNPVSASSNRKYGEFSSMEMVIRVDTSVDRIKVVDTLMHEICHAVFWVYGIHDEDDEERTVGTISTGLIQVYKDNPDVLIFMQEHLRESVVVS